VDNVDDWTAQVFGLGVLGPMIEFNANTASLDWIGTEVVAHGAHSGDLKGEIKALFYRYRSVGGTDYVSDFLIGGAGQEPLKPMPGDSGTLGGMEAPAQQTDGEKPPARRKPDPLMPAKFSGRVYRPFALQWGGQKLEDGSAQFTQYALGSSLSLICRKLD